MGFIRCLGIIAIFMVASSVPLHAESLGENLFREKCGGCHSNHFEQTNTIKDGTVTVPALGPVVTRLSEERFIFRIRNGRMYNMPKFNELTDNQLSSLYRLVSQYNKNLEDRAADADGSLTPCPMCCLKDRISPGS